MTKEHKQALVTVLSEYKFGQITTAQCLKEIDQIYEYHKNEKQNG